MYGKVNCETGVLVKRPLSTAEQTQHAADLAAAAAQEQVMNTARAQRDADRAVVAEKAQLDPAFAALARLAGVGAARSA